MLRIPYGESNFQQMMVENFFYQDRSMYIRKLEQEASRFVFFLRPRRFGKTLFVSMLRYYYGLEHKEQFCALFGKLAIGRNPTPLANGYLVLSFEFSRILTDTPEHSFNGFLNNVREGAALFINAYREFFTDDQKDDILRQDLPNEILKKLFEICALNRVPYPVYVVIDEYDHFANELVSFHFDYFRKPSARTGLSGNFMKSLNMQPAKESSIGSLQPAFRRLRWTA